LFNEFIFWIAFAVIAVVIIIIDLYVTDHRQGKMGLKKSLIWSGVWISTALLFFVAIHFFLEKGPQRSLEFITGYLIEYSLSVDNLFVFLLIFKTMGVSPENQPHILKWGILSAVVLRIIFILIGVGLINLFQPIIYVFGLILLYGASAVIKKLIGRIILLSGSSENILIYYLTIRGRNFLQRKMEQYMQLRFS
jgi:tellurite resistance protein TerC